MDKLELAKWAQGVLQLVIDGKKSFDEVVRMLGDMADKIARAEQLAKYAEAAKQIEVELMEKVATVSKEFPAAEVAWEVKAEEVKAEAAVLD